MIIKNIFNRILKIICNLYNILPNRMRDNSYYFDISNKFKIIYNVNMETKFDTQNKISNKYNNLDINYYSIIIMIITILDILLILIKRILNLKKNKADKINKTKKYNLMVNINFILIFIIKTLIILYLINQIKSKNIILQDSKIYLKIKGIGENSILGNEGNNNKFRGIKHLKYVYINEKQENSIKYNYNFNQTNNSVELMFDDGLDDCGCMFGYCKSITEINLSNFDTSKVINMDYMFSQCTSLTSLDLSNFNTSKVKSMWRMFYYCSSLTSLDLSNFDTSNVNQMAFMFEYCSSLNSLNLSNFDTSNVTRMTQMFYKCINLEYINLKKFKEIKLITYNKIFVGVPENIVICIDENNIKDKILQHISNITCHTIYCSDDWKSKQKKIINNTNKCINSCENSNQYKYEYNGKCYETCSNGFLYDENNNKLDKCKCELDKCLTCPNVAQIEVCVLNVI